MPCMTLRISSRFGALGARQIAPPLVGHKHAQLNAAIAQWLSRQLLKGCLVWPLQPIILGVEVTL